MKSFLSTSNLNSICPDYEVKWYKIVGMAKMFKLMHIRISEEILYNLKEQLQI